MSGANASYGPALDAVDDIAIIGMSCRFPGASGIEEYWRNLRDGVESISPVSTLEMVESGVNPTAARDPHRVAVASALADIESFDADFFDFTPKQAELTDPQHRIFLECAWEALESAGYDPVACGSTIGVFAGSSISTYLLFHLRSSISPLNRSSDLQVLIGNDKDYLATQVAYKLGLKGPAVNIQTACSTSLVAVHMACQSLVNRECDVALAGGVTVRLPLRAGYQYDVGGILSPDGHCRPFDADGQGTVFGSGAGIVVLKRLVDAVADGDVVDAVIRGSAVNNDGSLKAGYTAPSEDGQAEVVAQALANAAVDPDTIDYVEMHGTGTPIGDPIEVAALTRAFQARAGGRRLHPGSCAIGAVKSNIGHLECAAGVAGLIKTVLALTHRQIPPSLHYVKANPDIDFPSTPFRVNTGLAQWRARDTPRRACVSSFGIGGTNAHLVLEEVAVAPSRPNATPPDRPYLLPLSARSPGALLALVSRYREFLDPGGPGYGLALGDVCWSAGKRRRHHDYRMAVVARTRDELLAQLATVGKEQVTPSRRADRRGKVVFVFPGQGSQWIGMGRQLLEREPVFRAVVERCDEVVAAQADWSLLADLSREGGDQSWYEHTDRVQLASFAVQVGLAALWRSLGIEPDAVVGHSMGEIAAARVAGVVSLDDAVRILRHRNRLIRDAVGHGRMLAVGCTADRAGELLAGLESQVSLAIVNSPKSVVLSGDSDALEEVAQGLSDQGAHHRWINVDFASHSPHMDRLVEPLRAALQGLGARPATMPIISTTTGRPIEGTRMDAEYWARNLREPVQFAEATRWLGEHDYDIFVEISAHPILLPAIEDSLYELGLPGTAVSSLRRDSDEQRSLLESLGTLYQAGQAIRWDELNPPDSRFVRPPLYPWQRQRYWVDPPRPPTPEPAPAESSATHPLLGRPLRSPLKDRQFESRVDLAALPYLDDHRVCQRPVFPAAGYLVMLQEAVARSHTQPSLVTDIALHAAMTVPDQTGRLVHTVVTPTDHGGGLLNISSWDPQSKAWQLHVTATQRAISPEDDTPVPDLQGIRNRCPREVSPSSYYERLRAEGLDYGPRFRGIESLRVGLGEALGQVRLPETLAGEAGRYVLHPALLDACLQLIGAAFDGDPAPTSNRTTDRDTGHVHLPVGVASFRVTAPAPKLVTGHAIVRDQPDGQARSGDVRLYGERGELIAEVLDLRVKAVSRSALRRVLRSDDVADWFYELRWRRQERPDGTPLAWTTPPTTNRDRWLIFADRGGLGRAIADEMERWGVACNLVYASVGSDMNVAGAGLHIDPASPYDFTQLLSRSGDGYGNVIYLWGLDATPLEETTADSLATDNSLLCGGAMHLVQALTAHPWVGSSRLWLVTCGAASPQVSAGSPAPVQSTLWGLGRTLAVEHPDLVGVCVDLDTESLLDNARTLVAEVAARYRQDQQVDPAGDLEDQVAFRHGERFVARLARVAANVPSQGIGESTIGESLQLMIPARGDLNDLTIRAVPRRPPATGEVEIRIRATGLNFRDVLNVLGVYPGDPGQLGLECAGDVIAVGDGVEEFRLGDAVVALAHGCFGSFATVPSVLVARKPSSLSYTDAATIPIAFLTAFYGLHHLAKTTSGDRVLIHSAAGGLGLAATQLARRAGAEVFGTAGSEAKRSYLRSLGVQNVMHSRTLDFASEVLRMTDGRGVDVVLNALGGDYVASNLSVLRSEGRFIEVGKTGAWDTDRVRKVRPDASYFLLDLGEEARRNPELIGIMLRNLMADFERGSLRPLPRHVFDMDEATDAFRLMAQAKHIGKIVITQAVSGSDSAAIPFRHDASYLITGGLGGLGQRVARWMVEHGARHIVLVGRSAPTAESEAVVAELTLAGAKVLMISADVSRPDHVALALRTIGESLPPLRGVVHAAGIIDDGMLLGQNWVRFARVLAPKVQGAWNLHMQTRGAPLDFFVLFSSTAAIWGNPGQSSYAAANAFLDALAHTRQAAGLPGLSINWGGWSQIGLAARDQHADRMTGQGLDGITPDAGVAALEHVMSLPVAQLAVSPIDWPRFIAQFPADRVPVLLTEMSGEAAHRPAEDRHVSAGSDLRHRLDAAGPRNRRRVLTTYLSEQAKVALGLSAEAPLDPRRPLNELGLDSLMAIEMRSKLSIAVDRPLPATTLFDHPTLEALAGYLADEVLHLTRDGAEQGPAAATGGTPTPRARPEANGKAADLTQLSDGDVAAVLAEELVAVQALLSGGRT